MPHLTLLHFPEITLKQRDGHKLRGYFANLFGQESDLFHNRTANGQYKYRYPFIQYKIVSGSPMMIGIGDGAGILNERFLRIKEIDIDGRKITLHQKNLKSEEIRVEMNGELYTYEFVTPWQALNQDTHRQYLGMNVGEQKQKLKGILVNNLISFFKAVGFQAEDRIMVNLQLKEILIKFKDQPMKGFKGQFTCNVLLPDFIGLGKSVSRGFGTIKQMA